VISDRAKALVEALHEPFSNEKRWIIAQKFLDEEKAEATKAPLGATLAERIAQTRGHEVLHWNGINRRKHEDPQWRKLPLKDE
jgi:hypothetical protein